MAFEFKVPQLGDNIDTIQVTAVMVKAGDAVEIEQPVVELETDKATIEVPSTVAGTVLEVHVAAGDQLKTGDLLLSVDAGEAAAAAEAIEEVQTQPEPEVPAKPAEAEPEAATEAETAPPAAQQVEAVPAPPPEVEVKPDERLTAPESVILSEGVQVPASPSVRRFAREIGIEIHRVAGSGAEGRVSIDDVKTFARALNEGRATAAPAAEMAAPSPLPDFSRWGEIERHKMSVVRKVTAERMAQSWSQVPHVTIYDKVDITELEALRLKFADRAEKLGGKLSMAVMVCKVVGHALKQYPRFNASLDLANQEIIYKKSIHLGIAVNTERGLMVPVVRDADRKNMVELSVEILHLAQKVRTGKIALEEMEGGTFTVSNLGRVSGTFFTPIVNYPEVAILGIGRTHNELALVAGQVQERIMLPLSLSFDHRVIDGADGAAFLRWVTDAIREPMVLALEG